MPSCSASTLHYQRRMEAAAAAILPQWLWERGESAVSPVYNSEKIELISLPENKERNLSTTRQLLIEFLRGGRLHVLHQWWIFYRHCKQEQDKMHKYICGYAHDGRKLVKTLKLSVCGILIASLSSHTLTVWATKFGLSRFCNRRGGNARNDSMLQSRQRRCCGVLLR